MRLGTLLNNDELCLFNPTDKNHFLLNIHVFQKLTSSASVLKKNKTEPFFIDFLDRLALVNCERLCLRNLAVRASRVNEFHRTRSTYIG